MEYKIVYYAKTNGKIPVEDFLSTLQPKLRAKALLEIELLEQHGDNLREPYVKPIKGREYKGIYELRMRFGKDSARIFYFMYIDNTYVLLNGFLKKTNKTPAKELERALKYKNDYEKRCKE